MTASLNRKISRATSFGSCRILLRSQKSSTPLPPLTGRQTRDGLESLGKAAAGAEPQASCDGVDGFEISTFNLCPKSEEHKRIAGT